MEELLFVPIHNSLVAYLDPVFARTYCDEFYGRLARALQGLFRLRGYVRTFIQRHFLLGECHCEGKACRKPAFFAVCLWQKFINI
jgi:hypothetical protein